MQWDHMMHRMELRAPIDKACVLGIAKKFIHIPVGNSSLLNHPYAKANPIESYLWDSKSICYSHVQTNILGPGRKEKAKKNYHQLCEVILAK